MAANSNARALNIEKLVTDLGIPKEHGSSVTSISTYFDKHRINELFNEMMTNIL